MAVNRRLPKERLNLDPGLVRKTKPRGKNHLKPFWILSQREMTLLPLAMKAEVEFPKTGSNMLI